MISDEKEKFKRVRVLCREDSLRDVLAVLLSGNFKSEVPAAKNEAALDFRRVEGDDPYEKPIKRLSSVAKYAGWKYTLPEKKQDLPQDFDSKTEEIYNKYKKFKRDKQLLLEQREECEEGKNEFACSAASLWIFKLLPSANSSRRASVICRRIVLKGFLKSIRMTRT